MKTSKLTKAPYNRFRKDMAKEFSCTPAVIDKAVKAGLKLLAEADRAGDPWAEFHRKLFLPAYYVGFQFWLMDQIKKKHREFH